MVWDGLIFFGFDDTKLARLNNVKTSYFDKFKNKKWLMFTSLSLLIIVFVLTSEVSKLGTIKTQKIELIDKANFVFNASNVLTMNAVNYYYTAEFFPLVRKL